MILIIKIVVYEDQGSRGLGVLAWDIADFVQN